MWDYATTGAVVQMSWWRPRRGPRTGPSPCSPTTRPTSSSRAWRTSGGSHPRPSRRYECQQLISEIVGSGGRAVERRTVNRGDGGSIPPAAVSKLREFRSLHITQVYFGRDTESLWSFLSGVYARGCKISHTGVNVSPVVDKLNLEKDNSKN